MSMTNEQKAFYNDALEAAAKIADGWLAQFGGVRPEIVTAQNWANGAVRDIADQIRKLKQ